MKIQPRTLLINSFLAGSIVLFGCNTMDKPDLTRLYLASHKATDQPPVVVIHGLMGGKLRRQDNHTELWPGDITDIAFSNYEHLALPIEPTTLEPADDGLETFAITDKTAGQDFYRAILQTLEGPGGFHPMTPGNSVKYGTRNYYVFTYDWRQDNVTSAKKLSQFIEQIRHDYHQPNLKVDIIAHSMGGLIARYYLRYGESDVLNNNDFPLNQHGGERVRRVVLLGTPNIGSVESIQAFIEGFNVGFGSLPTEVMATMPSLYQLFPHPISPWLITIEGNQLERDIFDVEIWKRFQWSIFNPKIRQRIKSKFTDIDAAEEYLQTLERYFEKHLERARRFVWSLTVPVEKVPWRLIVFGGDCALTPARMVVEEIEGESVIKLWPDNIENPLPEINYGQLMLEPGDGSVTKASLLARESLDPTIPRHSYSFFPLDYAFFLCEKHNRLTGNINFQDNLLNTLLTRDERF